MDVSETTTTPIERDDDLLNDDHELDTLDQPAALDADDPVHLAKCAECAEAVRFRPNVTGTGFFLVDADPDASYGIGEHGRPMCRNGHGEMSIADDQFKPVSEAFSEAQTMLQSQEGGTPQQVALPGVFPAFNYEGAFHEIAEQARRVERLKSESDRAKADALEAKKALDKGAELLMRMTLEFERRRKEKPTDDQPATPARTPCTWEAKRTDGETCPLCNPGTVPLVIEMHLGDPAQLAPADAQAHVDDVEKLLLGLEVDETREALENVDTFIDDDVIRGWTSDERAAVKRYADAQLDKANNVPDVVMPERPAVLGKPHIPAQAIEGAHQVCSLCEVVIHAASDEDNDPYALTDYVGTNCAGKVVDAPRYPKSKGSKKPAAKKAGKKKARS